MNDVTKVLSALENGDAQASDELLPLVYHELRQLAAAKMANERPGQTLDATGLVFDCWTVSIDQGIGELDTPSSRSCGRASGWSNTSS